MNAGHTDCHPRRGAKEPREGDPVTTVGDRESASVLAAASTVDDIVYWVPFPRAWRRSPGVTGSVVEQG